ncbi:ABC transporter substrate-binding protein [Anaerovibrio slackiae]|uniref:ABC transporter substrate-binding protein n=1 Tax=Anaerovibrio slackiae TaxID=2652309 RepID=UPI00386762DE
MKWKSLLAVLSVSALLVTTGCGSDAAGTGEDASKAKFTASNTYQGDLSGVTLNIGAASSQNAQGIVEAAGLADTPYKVEFHNMRSGSLVLEAIAANQLDAGCGSQIPPIFASLANNGGNFKIIAIRKGTTLNQELIVSPQAKENIKTVADLKGKKVGYVKNTTAQYFLYKMLSEAGLKWTDIDALPMSTSDGLSAITTGDIDALASYDNAVIIGKEKGGALLRSAEDILSGDYYWYATLDTIKDPAKHAALVDYMERINEANEWARNHPREWAEYASKESNQSPDDIQKRFEAGEAQRKGRIAPIDDATIASEQDIIDSFVDLGALKSKIEAVTLFDKSFVDEIAKFKVY